ncbi:MAG TPA: hypothetical protein VHF89_05985 [Solirubrobacteraceae bacterium]|nr:hypothetical protein [Solirubrobacteraceae bacterium]
MRARLRAGAPWIAVAAIALVAIVALLAIAALRTEDSPRGYAQVRASEGACRIEPARSRDVITCARIGPNIYRIVFTRSIGSRPVVATRETCCPGPILASIEADKSVLIALPRQRTYPVVFNVVVP